MSLKRPTTTPFPDEILDYWLPELSCTELRCLCYIVRHTFGYGKNITGDPISLRQFMKGITRADGQVIDGGTGIKSRGHLAEALLRLERRGLIRRTQRTSLARDSDITVYVLDLEDENRWPLAAGGQLSAPGGSALRALPSADRALPVVPSGNQGSALREPGVVPSGNPQETTKQETTKQETTGKDGRSASGDAPPAQSAKNGAKARERACKTPEEEDQRERLMRAFNDLLRPIDFCELGRCRNEMLRGLREHKYEGMEGCMRAMSTSKRFVGQSWVTPVTVVRNVLLWEDAGRPRQWARVEEYAGRKARRHAETGG